MRLGFYTYSYTDRLDMAIPPVLERIAATGYSGIDVSGTYGNSADPKSFDQPRRKLMRSTAERLRLRIEAVITHAQLTDTLADPNRPTLDLKGSVDLAADLGAPVVTFHMGGYHDGISREKEWNNAVREIRAACDHGQKKDVVVAVDGIWPEWIDDSSDALQRMFDEVDSEHFGVNFDPCYLTLISVDPVQFLERFAKRVVHAHLKDHRGMYPKWTHLLPGAGDMDYERVFAGMKGAGFSGSASVECFTNMEFKQACDECFADMTMAAEDAGVKFTR